MVVHAYLSKKKDRVVAMFSGRRVRATPHLIVEGMGMRSSYVGDDIPTHHGGRRFVTKKSDIIIKEKQKIIVRKGGRVR